FLWDIPTRKIVHVLEGHADHGIVPLFNHAGDVLASTDWTGVLRLWDVHSGRQIHLRERGVAITVYVQLAPWGNSPNPAHQGRGLSSQSAFKLKRPSLSEALFIQRLIISQDLRDADRNRRPAPSIHSCPPREECYSARLRRRLVGALHRLP